MTTDQALEILRETTPDLQVPLQTHMAVQRAINTLAAAVAPVAPLVDEPIDPAEIQMGPKSKTRAA